MEANLFIVLAFVITISKTTLQGDQERTFNGTSLDNFHEVVSALVADNEKTDTPNEVNGTEVHVEVQSDDKLFTNQDVINSVKENTSISETDVNTENPKSQISYLNELLKSLPLDENVDELDTSDIAKILNRRRNYGEPTSTTSTPANLTSTEPPEEADLVSKEEITVEIEDLGRSGLPILPRNMVLNDTLADFFTKKYKKVDDTTMKPETTTPQINKNEKVLRPRTFEVPQIPFDANFPHHQDTTNLKLLTELNKLNAKMDDVEDLLKGNMNREDAQIGNGRRFNGGMVNGGSSGRNQAPKLNRSHPNNQANPPNNGANEYHRVNDPHVVAKPPPPQKDVTHAGQNQMLLFQLGRIAQKRQDMALMHSLPQPSRVILHLPPLYRRRLIVTR